MPSKSVQQRKLFGAARGCQKGTSPCKGKAGEIARRVDPATVREFARKTKKP